MKKELHRKISCNEKTVVNIIDIEGRKVEVCTECGQKATVSRKATFDVPQLLKRRSI